MSGEWIAGGFALGGVALGYLGTPAVQRADRLTARRHARLDDQRAMTAEVLVAGREWVRTAKSFVIFAGASTEWHPGRDHADLYGRAIWTFSHTLVRARLTISADCMVAMVAAMQVSLADAPNQTQKVVMAMPGTARHAEVAPVVKFLDRIDAELDDFEQMAITELAEPK